MYQPIKTASSLPILIEKMPKDTFSLPVELLKIPDVRIIETDFNYNGCVIIDVESNHNETCCHQCGKKTEKTDGNEKPRLIRHLPLFSTETYLRISPKRCQCDCGAITIETFSWHTPKASCTSIYEDHLLLQIINSTISDVSIKEKIGYDTLKGIISRKIDTSPDWEHIKKIEVIGIDEISLKKGHKDFVTIVTGISSGKLLILGVLEGREKIPLKKFLKKIPAKIRKHVETICTDLYDGFINAAKEVFLKNTKITADRFHVAKLYRGSFDTLRKKEIKRLGKIVSSEDYKSLKGVMWTLRKNKNTLSPEEQKQLNLLFSHSSDLERAYHLMNELTDIFNEDINKFHGKHSINRWIRKVQRSGTKCFDTFIKTLNKFKDEIANYFISRRSSGFVEGLNNKIKVIKRRCYGILNKDHLYQRIYLDISGYSHFCS